MIEKYRKLPVVIEAEQWVPSSYAEAVLLSERWGATMGADGVFGVETLEGRHTISYGDWMIRGVKGEVYPCKPDIFGLTYERVTDAG